MTFPANAGRPLFIPAGIAVVRTGPTTRAELERLLAQDDLEASGIRPSARAQNRRNSVLRRLVDVLQLAPPALRSARRFESR